MTHRKPGRVRTARLLRDERGETLVESVVSVLLVGLTVVGLLGTMAAAARASGVNRRIVRSSVAVVDAAEKNIELATYRACSASAPSSQALVAQYRSTVTIQVPGYEVDIVDVRVATSRAGTSAQPVAFAPCAGSDTGLQAITVRARSTRGSQAVHNLVFYKRDPSCPTGYTSLFPGQPC